MTKRRIEDEIQQEEFKNSSEKAFVNLIFTANWIGMKQKRFFRAYGISPQQYNVLRILRGVRQKNLKLEENKRKNFSILDIQNLMLDKMSNASRLVDKLFKKGYVSRTENMEDRRQVAIEISESGLELLKDLDKEMKVFVGDLANITEQEAETLSGILDEMRNNSVKFL